MSKDLTIQPDPHYNPTPIAPVNQQFNDIMIKFNACVYLTVNKFPTWLKDPWPWQTDLAHS